MKISIVEKIKQAFGDFDVVTFLEQHNVNYDEWLKSQIFQLLEAVEKDVLKILSSYAIIEKQKIREFQNWLIERERKTKGEFRKKGWGNTKLEITVVKEKFLETFDVAIPTEKEK